MSVAHNELARQTNNAADKLYTAIVEDVVSFCKGKAPKGFSVADAKRLVGLAVSSKGNPAAFDDKAKGTLGTKDLPHLGELQRKILARVQDHAKGAQLQSSVAAFSGGVRERVEGGGITKGGLIRAGGGDKPVFKKPEARSSLLGLKDLASKKREEEGTSLPVKRGRMSFEGQEDSTGAPIEAESGAREWKKKEGAAGRPNYRTKGSETPSVGSGLDVEARDRIQERDKARGRDGAMSFNSSGKGDDSSERNYAPRGDSWSRGAGSESVRSKASTRWESDTPVRHGGSQSGSSVANTPVRTSVDQFDIVTNIGQGRVPADRGDSSRSGGAGSSRGESSRGAERDKPLTEAEKQLRHKEYEAMEKELDRDWYDNDEGGAFLDESGSYDPFLGGADGDAGTKAADGRLKKKVSARQQAYLADDDKWIDNQLINSGVVTANRAADADDDTEGRVHLMTHNIMPPFLDGRQVLTKKQDAVVTVRDPSSDLAKIARKGCHSLLEYRKKRDLNKCREKFWEIEGSKIGGLMGVKDKAPEEEDENVNEDGDVDYKSGAQFGQHMKGKSEAQSEFAKTKTIKQQRESLPIYTVRDELLQVIRPRHSTPLHPDPHP